MFKRLKNSLLYWSSKALHPLVRPRMIGRLRNFQGRRIHNTSIGSTTYIDHPASLFLGHETYIGHHNYIEASHGIHIGDGCQITDFVSITTHSSHISIRLYGYAFHQLSRHKGYVTGEVSIGKFTFIGPHSVIMPGSVIGKGCIVKAFSFVKGSFPDFSVIAGNPATVVGDTRILDKEFLAANPELRVFYNGWAADDKQ
jgi:acetyltransferase-like isoleucine patch superfamily enzyme